MIYVWLLLFQLLITAESKSVYDRISDLLPVLRHLAAINVNEAQCQELVDILEELTSYVLACTLK